MQAVSVGQSLASISGAGLPFAAALLPELQLSAKRNARIVPPIEV
jgi:hypothetical protein